MGGVTLPAARSDRRSEHAQDGEEDQGDGHRQEQRAETSEAVGEEEEHAARHTLTGAPVHIDSALASRMLAAVPGTIEHLAALDIAGHEPSVSGGADHPMRVMTRRAAGLEQPPWDAAARAEVGALFDQLAPEWHTRSSPERTEVVIDALGRGGVGTGATALEVGSGIGAYSGLLAARFPRVLAVDLSIEMLRLAADAPGHRILADGSGLPVGDGAIDAVVLINMLLFPAEVDRVLAPSGCVVWVNSSGESTPIHLQPDEVVAALPGTWTGVAGRAGVGLWTVLRRSR